MSCLEETGPHDRGEENSAVFCIDHLHLSHSGKWESSAAQTHQNTSGTISQVKPGLVGLDQCEP